MPHLAHRDFGRTARRKDGPGPRRQPETGVWPRPCVLIVEDDEDARELIGWCMRAAGWIVRGADDAESALLVAAALAPDAIVMDLGLPGISGLDAIRRLKDDEFTKDVPVLVCTALSPAQAEPRAREAGCDAFLAKPCEPEDLRKLLESLVAHGRGPVED